MYRSIIVDDESIAIKRFEHLASKEERITLLASFTEPTEALSYIKEHPVDIAFLDIEMPGINGLDLAEQLQIQDPFISIIFITAYDHYALDAFQAHALGYLLKPVSLQDFSRQIDSLSRTKTPRKLDTPSMPTKQQADVLSVSCLGQFSCMTAAQTPIAFRTAKTAELLFLLEKRCRMNRRPPYPLLLFLLLLLLPLLFTVHDDLNTAIVGISLGLILDLFCLLIAFLSSIYFFALYIYDFSKVHNLFFSLFCSIVVHSFQPHCHVVLSASSLSHLWFI